MGKSIEKHFPADTSLQISTFLNNKSIDGRLYTYLQSKSFPVKVEGGYETRVDKFDLGSQKNLCQIINVKSPKTLRKYFDILIKTGYLQDRGPYYVLLQKERMYLPIPLNTVRFLSNVLKEDVIKIYIYLGQRYKYAKANGTTYIFTIKEICKHLGLSLTSQNSRNFVKDGLDALSDCQLISFVCFYEKNLPRMRLTKFSYQHKTNFGE